MKVAFVGPLQLTQCVKILTVVMEYFYSRRLISNIVCRLNESLQVYII